MHAQGWEQVYGGIARDAATDVIASPDGGFYMVGNTASLGSGDQDVYLIKTDPDGLEEWSKNIGDPLWEEYGNSIQFTSDGNLIIGGNAVQDSVSKFYIVKADLQGNVLWSQKSSLSEVEARSVIELPNGEFMVCGKRLFTRINANGEEEIDSDLYLLKFEPNNGQEINLHFQYGGLDAEDGYMLLNQGPDQVIVVGYTQSFGAGDYDIYVAEVNTQTAALVRDTTYGTTGAEIAHAFTATADGGYAITGQQNNDSTKDNFFLLKLTGDLQEEWFQTYSISGLEKAFAISATNNGYLLAGEYRFSHLHNRAPFVIKTDLNGTFLWQNYYGGLLNDAAQAIELAPDNSFVIAGFTFSYSAGSSDAYLIKSDSSGRAFSNIVYGNVYQDFDLDCAQATTEEGIPGWLIQANGNISRYALTDSSGNYSLQLDSGAYTIEPIAPSDYWAPCDDSYPVVLEGPFDTVKIDIPAQPEVDCPLLYVNLSTPFLRRCFQNVYSLAYCNEGTQITEDAYVDVHFDQFFAIDSASIPYTHSGQVYTFQLGDLDLFDCGEFQIFTTLSCDSTLTGQTHCVEARIYPDTICAPIDPSWDGSSIEVDATCDGDSVSFQITNVGEEDMEEINNYIIIEDYIVLLTGGFHLFSQQDTTFKVPTNGGSFRLEADQSQGHPGNNQPSISIEGCGGSPFSRGFITQLPQNDGNPYIDIDCQESIGSFDPNDKIAFPAGFDEEHFIRVNTDIEYLIRFQNTGSDTAFRVVIRDTISPLLDINGIQVGVGSHPFTHRVYGEGILQFTFDNIQLPDSSVNELASHGFIKFRIPQQPNNALGSTIYNNAGIYFDYNEPIITNRTYHRIGENFIQSFVSTSTDPELAALDIRYYPNPFVDHVTFEINNTTASSAKQMSFSLYDLQGRLLRRNYFEESTFVLERQSLAKGLYLFRIEQEGVLIGNGKLMIGQ